ncbi:MAG: NAD(P)-dependent oxidoreductase, partial [Candidatus ainarchaeum sp.]|nr:NAD(P)-dependent oxidoreductase [Candidatus ainarchaeum sp.]
MIEGGKSFRSLQVAIYDTPKCVGRSLSVALEKAGYRVLFEGLLKQETARTDADVWINKWSFNLKGDFLRQAHPKRGIITLSVGTEHIDKAALSELGLSLEGCPTFSSNSVAEHAMALAFRGIYGASILPPLSSGRVMFAGFSDDYAERAVAQILIRSRQIEQSIVRAKTFRYFNDDGRRPDEPWDNEELSGATVGIAGSERDVSALCRILKNGFNCDIFGHETSEGLEAYGIRPLDIDEMLDTCEYTFICSSRYDRISLPNIVTMQQLGEQERKMSGAKVSVLGTGRIGSIIASMAKLGFNCDVSAFSTSEREELTAIGVRYVPTLEAAMAGADFIFIALPLTDSTRSIIGEKQLGGLPPNAPVLVNVTREEIIDSDCLFRHISSGSVLAYATDV